MLQKYSLLQSRLKAIDPYGKFVLPSIWPGYYRVWVKGLHTLSRLSAEVHITPGTNMLDIGALLEGDGVPDNVVNILDFSLLRMSYGTADAHADFNQDGVVDILDFSLFSGNFGRMGDRP